MYIFSKFNAYNTYTEHKNKKTKLVKEHCNNTSARSIIQNRRKIDSIIKPGPFFLAKSLTVSVSISSKCANYIHDHYSPHGDRRLIEHHNQLDVAFEKVDDCLGCDIQKDASRGESLQ